MKGEGSPKAQATFKQSGMSRSQIFDGLSSALDFSVRLLQSHPAGDISELTIRDAEGQIAFTHDEIERLSALVRLSGSPRKPPA